MERSNTDDRPLPLGLCRYMAIVKHLGAPMAQPARARGPCLWPLLYRKGQCSARWTNLIEIGPWVTFTPEAWTAVWRRLVPFLQTGVGLDLVWCDQVGRDLGRDAVHTCLLVDETPLEHVNMKRRALQGILPAKAAADLSSLAGACVQRKQERPQILRAADAIRAGLLAASGRAWPGAGVGPHVLQAGGMDPGAGDAVDYARGLPVPSGPYVRAHARLEAGHI